jgi:hypothetical protein
MVHFSADINGEHVEEIYSRCKSRLFIICHTRNVDKIFSTETMKANATNFLQITDINGEHLYFFSNNLKLLDFALVISLFGQKNLPLFLKGK